MQKLFTPFGLNTFFMFQPMTSACICLIAAKLLFFPEVEKENAYIFRLYAHNRGIPPARRKQGCGTRRGGRRDARRQQNARTFMAGL